MVVEHDLYVLGGIDLDARAGRDDDDDGGGDPLVVGMSMGRCVRREC